ncbi:hypothetical protein V8B97DRAFT_1944546 [Scleroderma yunnanense]
MSPLGKDVLAEDLWHTALVMTRTKIVIGRTVSAVLGDADEPTEHEIIGYVTTDDLSLSRGEGFALGAIPVVQYVALRRQAQRLTQLVVVVKSRDQDATTSRVAYLKLLDV